MSRSTAAWLLALCGLAMLLGAGPARANEPANPAAEARRHFDRGIALSDRGEIGAAVAEFRQAYELVPHPAVLFNLGRAYSALGRHADAVRTLRRYLRESTNLKPDHRAQVESLLNFNSARVGLLELKLAPSDAEVVVDGASRGRGAATLELDPGAHGVLVMAPNHVSWFRNIDVKAGQRVSLGVSLQPDRGAAAGQGQLIVSCPVPSAGVEVDGTLVGTTPTLPLLLPAGNHRVNFVRAGFARSEHDVAVPSGGKASVTCAMQLDARSPAATAWLRLTGLPRGARVAVNGLPFTGNPLPPGTHELTVVHPEYEVWRRAVELPPGSWQVLEAHLQPTLATRRRQAAERSQTRRVWVMVTAGAGVLLAGTGTALYLANTSQVDRWNREHDAVTALLSDGSAGPAILERNRQLQDDAAAIQRTDDLALGLAISGGVALSVGLWLWLSDHGSQSLIRAAGRPELRFNW